MRLYLVIDDGSGYGAMLALAEGAAEAVSRAREALVGKDGVTDELRAVTADTATNPKLRTYLSTLEPIALEATNALRADLVEKELNAPEALLDAIVTVFEREKARAVAEAIELDRAAIRDAMASNSVENCKKIAADAHALPRAAEHAVRRAFDRAVERSIADREKRINAADIFAGGGTTQTGGAQ